MKTIKMSKASFDNAIILPRSWNERQPKLFKLNTKERAIKHIGSSTNFSDEVAAQLYEAKSSKY